MKRVDIFRQVKDASKHAQEFKGLPNLRNLSTAQETIKTLDRLYKKYEKAKDNNGMLHCTLIAEIAENQTMRKGLIGQLRLYREWLNKVKKI
ncbi:MAG: hypothetical protein KAT77_01220 [Nanoarchaeota archaeon]|nr:hypothetical protein [Nanoarchaeota archaeon]